MADTLRTRAQIEADIQAQIRDLVGTGNLGIDAADVANIASHIAASMISVDEGEAIVENVNLLTPPGSPTHRQAHVVSTAGTATGAWAGREGDVAIWDNNAAAWFFYTPRNGSGVFNRVDRAVYRFNTGSGAWESQGGGGGGGGLIARTVFTSSGSWTKNASAQTALIRCTGGGGGGGGAGNNGAMFSIPGGGVGGATAEVFLNAGALAAVSGAQTVTVGAGGAGGAGATGATGGAGGTTSVAALCSASGGAGGPGRTGGTAGGGRNTGQSGTGDFWVAGQCGESGVEYLNVALGGNGGASYYGGGARGGRKAIGTGGDPGDAATTYGAGGGAGVSYDATANGGAGGGGIVIIEEYA